MESFDLGVNLAFWLTIVSTVLCVVYGYMNWNKEDKEDVKVLKKWAKDEDKMEKEL